MQGFFALGNLQTVLPQVVGRVWWKLPELVFAFRKISCARPCAGLFKVYKGGARQAWEVLMENFLRGFEVTVLLPSLQSHSKVALVGSATGMEHTNELS